MAGEAGRRQRSLPLRLLHGSASDAAGPDALNRERPLASLARYWIRGADPIRALPIPTASRPAPGEGEAGSPPELTSVELPPWGASCGVDGALVVPRHVVTGGPGPRWQQVDWLTAAGWYLGGVAERDHERRHGPIHSYSLRLRGWPPELWSRAWVNRIALFLRAWAARGAEVDDERLLGALPSATVLLTHDVDAIRKTVATRVKQSAFHSLNAVRHLAKGELSASRGRVASAARFAFGSADYWRFPEMTALEQEFGWRSVFHLYAGPRAAGRTPRLRLMDPSYDPGRPPLREELSRLVEGGWAVGLHPSFDTWRDPGRMRRERLGLSEAAGHPVTLCRQHWLRFSWGETWAAQAASGIELDSTLGFNDRPGFRNGAALAMRPWDPGSAGGDDPGLRSLPLVLMDAHLYDYRPMNDTERADQMRHWLGEIATVRGQASVLWHQRVLSPDYGWGRGYQELLETIRDLGIDVAAPVTSAFD